MLFLVLLQLGPFKVDDFDLPVEVLFYSVVVLCLFVEVFQLLVDALFFLFDAGFCVVDPSVLFENFFIVFGL